MSVILMDTHHAQRAHQASFEQLKASVKSLQANVNDLTELLTAMPESSRKQAIERQIDALPTF